MAGSNDNQEIKDKFREDLLKYVDQFNTTKFIGTNDSQLCCSLSGGNYNFWAKLK